MAEKILLKAFQLGLGVMDLTKQEVSKIVKDLNIDTNTKEGRKLVDKFVKDGKEASKKLEKKIADHSKKLSSGFVTRKDFERLEKKLDALAKKKSK